tara:strand:+ start:367 stop:810 length:444 start_codon:yes stop_codon:yes gene_type:complete
MERILTLLQRDMEKYIDKYFNDHELRDLSGYINSLITNEKIEQFSSQALKTALEEQSMEDGYWWMEYGEYIQHLDRSNRQFSKDLSLLKENINSYINDKQDEFYTERGGKKKSKRRRKRKKSKSRKRKKSKSGRKRNKSKRRKKFNH